MKKPDFFPVNRKELSPSFNERKQALRIGRKQENKTIEHLRGLALHDELTGLENRRFFEQNMNAQFTRLIEGKGRKNNPRTISIIVIDTDKFKEINDNYGHPAGDKVLKRIAETLQSVVRKGYDHVDRHGGDEWTIGFVDVDQETAFKKMQALVEEMRGLEIDIGGGKSVKVTLSIGITTASRGSGARTLGEALKQADAAMYQAKEEGRNRVVPWAKPDKNRPGYQHELNLGI